MRGFPMQATSSFKQTASALKQVEIFTWENINKATERQSWKMK